MDCRNEDLLSGSDNVEIYDYNEIKDLACCQAVIDEAVKKWDKLCLLDAIDDDEKKREVAMAFNNLQKTLTDYADTDHIIFRLSEIFNDFGYEYNTDGLIYIFAILAKVCVNVDNFDFDRFLEKLNRFSYLTVIEDNVDYYNYPNFDAEAEYVMVLSTLIINSFKNDKE